MASPSGVTISLSPYAQWFLSHYLIAFILFANTLIGRRFSSAWFCLLACVPIWRHPRFNRVRIPRHVGRQAYACAGSRGVPQTTRSKHFLFSYASPLLPLARQLCLDFLLIVSDKNCDTAQVDSNLFDLQRSLADQGDAPRNNSGNWTRIVKLRICMKYKNPLAVVSLELDQLFFSHKKASGLRSFTVRNKHVLDVTDFIISVRAADKAFSKH